jgi:trimethylamine--corrinoid protein Co-methyltransferase
LLEILSKDALYKIHLATIEILRSVGVKVYHEGALRALEDAGADVNYKNKVVRIHEYVVKEALRKAPSSFSIYGRNRRNFLRLGGDRVYISTAGSSAYVLDFETGKRRYATLRDTALLSRLADGLGNIDHVSEMAFPGDVPEEAMHAYELVERLRNTEKPTDGYTFGGAETLDTVKIASTVLGGEEELRNRPSLLGFHNPTSPLTHSEDGLEGLRIYGEYGQPVIIAPEAQGGMTAPATLAGLLSQTNAEILSGIVIAELLNPGAPVLYGTVSAGSDPRTGNIALGGPETGLINVAHGQMARYYEIPSRGTGGVTDAIDLGVQSGIEQATTLTLAALAGINFIYYAAGPHIESTKTVSYEQLIIGDELCGIVSRILQGIEVNEDSLAVDVTKAVGPEGMFISQRHTLEHFQENFIPKIMNRDGRETWERKGSKTIQDISREAIARILATHHPKPLEPDVDRELTSIIKDIEKRGPESKARTAARTS